MDGTPPGQPRTRSQIPERSTRGPKVAVENLPKGNWTFSRLPSNPVATLRWGPSDPRIPQTASWKLHSLRRLGSPSPFNHKPSRNQPEPNEGCNPGLRGCFQRSCRGSFAQTPSEAAACPAWTPNPRPARPPSASRGRLPAWPGARSARRRRRQEGAALPGGAGR